MTTEKEAAASTAAGRRAAAWLIECLGAAGTPTVDRLAGELAEGLEERLLPRGTVAFRQGRMPDGVWIIRSGTLELVTGSGRDRVVIGVLSPCGVAGDAPLLLGSPAGCTARALTDVRAGFLPAARFLAMLDGSPALTRLWLRSLARQHARTQEILAQTLNCSAERRVAGLLLREARGAGVHCSQATLAGMLGLRRPTLNRVLKDFERAGLLRVGYRRVELLDAGRLNRLARGERRTR
ncbi:Crp/Fnr family transcriptional regulator [Streptomyces aidingensis]|uniref:cAMP-binding domain of CRP or a regulatory subunit of cAMP-dependent protein kinases n=1 Tax=Streptomyces aidingensis TaxID=910347 RepID=A0A1I1F910_9ACTN|nr:Crp/Fnr family transcriptional regulator [Streptomyces aidingensis]SFB95827.1 cAMP-binding domain of CRP or a regulatory subunit of cAMP-dependent protein kinases [Streptomyces aidingensis]